MSRLSAILPVLLLPLALAACFPRPDYTDLPNIYAIPRSVEVLDSIAIGDLAAVSAAEREAVAAALARGGDSGLRVKIHLSPAAARMSDAEIRAQIAALGIDPAIAVVEHQGAVPQTVLEFVRVTVGTPDCAAMVTRSEATKTSGRPNMSFGCATLGNLSRMVTDPADLVRGRSYGDEGGVAAAQGVDRYNQGKVTPLRQTTSVGGVGNSGSSQ